MFITQTLKMCYKNVLSNKLRSFLSMLGIIIGISSVIILVGFTQGTTQDINTSLQNLGANVVTLTVYNEDNNNLDYEEVKNLDLNFAEDILMLNQTRIYAKKNNSSGMYLMVGTTSNFFEVNKFTLEEGRGIVDLEIDKSSKVAVLGATVAESIFENINPVGEKILLGSDFYTIIGVMSENSSSDNDYDSSIIIPITTYANANDDSTISKLYFVGDEQNTNTTMMERMIINTLSRYISSDNLEVVSKDTVNNTISEVDEITTILITLIGAISLFVSGIGVMNIMIVSVSERTREIGVRKAIGATDSDILTQFLIEAVLLTTIGGFIGVLVVYLFKFLAMLVGTSFIIDNKVVLISLAFSVMIGMLFGIIPAIRASKLKPIDALKYE